MTRTAIKRCCCRSVLPLSRSLALLLAIGLLPAIASAQPPAAPPAGGGQAGPTADLVKQGVGLDLNGEYAEARKLFAKAIDAATTPEAKAQAMRSMAMSYAFENNCKEAAKYETPLYQQYLDAKKFYDAGEIANELARVCLEAGDIDTAAKWYQTGYDAGMREPDLKPDRKDLWEFRLEHAKARIAARRGDKADAQKHVDAAKIVLDKGTNPNQQVFYPYLTGYVAFYAGDYKTALTELKQANQNDPFILLLTAQAYEKIGDDAQAKTLYEKILTFKAHNPPNAFARPIAQKKLGEKRS
jgi:tetratricopeptide (TPR) repeat protein